MGTVPKRTRRVRQPPANSGQAGMVVRSMDLASLVPYERNPRKRPKEAVVAVAASLKKFGWQQPIVVDSKNVISVGHTRHAAALSLGWTTAPVVVIPDDQAAAYRLVDNRSGEFTVWDNDLLRAELDALPSLDGFDLEVFDFDALLPARGGLTDPDDIPETPKNPVARTGDLWVLGKHRIVCGDSTNQETVERLLDGAKPDLMVTDPPYGVNYDADLADTRPKVLTRKTWRLSANPLTTTPPTGRPRMRSSQGAIAYVWMSKPRPSGGGQRARRLRLHPALAHHLGQGAHRDRPPGFQLPASMTSVVDAPRAAGVEPTSGYRKGEAAHPGVIARWRR